MGINETTSSKSNLRYPIWNTKKEPCIIIIKLGSYFITSQVLISLFPNLVNSWYFDLSNAQNPSKIKGSTKMFALCRDR